MNADKNQPNKAQSQTTGNPSLESANNPFENNQPVEQDVRQAKEELEKEQQFKEAQTERD